MLFVSVQLRKDFGRKLLAQWLGSAHRLGTRRGYGETLNSPIIGIGHPANKTFSFKDIHCLGNGAGRNREPIGEVGRAGPPLFRLNA